MNEATTRSAVIDPVLDAMGWRPWRCEVPLKEGGKVDYYHDSTRVAIEAKSANPLYDDLGALNPTSAYRNNLEQAVSYLDSSDVRPRFSQMLEFGGASNVMRHLGGYTP